MEWTARIDKLSKEDKDKYEHQNKETINIELSSNVISLWKENDESKYLELARELEYSDELISFLCRYQKERW